MMEQEIIIKKRLTVLSRFFFAPTFTFHWLYQCWCLMKIEKWRKWN